MYSTYFPPHYSGAAKQGIALAKKLREHGHHVEFVTVRRANEKFQDEFEHFRVWRIKDGRGKYGEIVFWLCFFAFILKRRKQFDILHSHGAYYYNSIVGPLGRLFGIKSLVKTSMANNDLSGLGERLSGRLHLLFLKCVDAYVAISKDLLNELSGLGFPAERVHFLPNAVDTDHFKPTSDELQRDKKKSLLNVPSQQCIALTAGVFDKRKNIGWLIQKWVENEGFGTGALLVAVGPQSREDMDGSFLQSLKKTANGAPGLVRIVGHVDNIEEYFQAADFFILPSVNEGMPNVVLEAMSSGLPCVATRISGSLDLIQEGVNGYFFTANDADSLSAALNKLLTDQCGKAGREARKIIENNYSLNRLAEDYVKLYSKMAKNRSV